jgi:hypothetical protein
LIGLSATSADDKIEFSKPVTLNSGKPGKNNRVSIDQSSGGTLTFYIKLFRPTKDLNYRFSINFQDLD